MGNPLEESDFYMLFDSVTDALLLVDAVGHVVMANPAARQLLGYGKDEMANLMVEDLIPSCYRINHRQHRSNFSNQPEKRSMGNGKTPVALHRDGRKLPVEIKLTPLQTQGKPGVLVMLCNIARQRTEDALRASEERLVGIMKDITEHKAMERRLRDRRNERESLLTQQVAIQTASAIAHELNQPLAAISAYSEVALRALGNSDVTTETLNRALNGCVDQAHRAGQSLHELLDFLHRGELILESIDLNSIVRETITIAQNDGFGGFQPLLELEHGLPLVLGNRIQVQKVLVNLLRNGIEAMREAKMPTSAIKVNVQTMAGRYMAQVTVQDSGPGLDVEAAKRAFEPFFTTKPSGIGLGLAISRSLIEANGGQLWIDPSAEPGATFHFTLPFAP